MKKILNNKSISRIIAIQILYQYDREFNYEEILIKILKLYKDDEFINEYNLEEKVKIRPSLNFLKELTRLTCENLKEADDVINQFAKKKSFQKVLLAILRVAICEIKYFPNTPNNVIINEYTDITSDMLNRQEVGFVNSILDNFCNS